MCNRISVGRDGRFDADMVATGSMTWNELQGDERADLRTKRKEVPGVSK